MALESNDEDWDEEIAELGRNLSADMEQAAQNHMDVSQTPYPPPVHFAESPKADGVYAHAYKPTAHWTHESRMPEDHHPTLKPDTDDSAPRYYCQTHRRTEPRTQTKARDWNNARSRQDQRSRHAEYGPPEPGDGRPEQYGADGIYHLRTVNGDIGDMIAE